MYAPAAPSGLLTVRFHGAANAPPSDNVYVKGLPLGYSEDDVAALFGSCGTIKSMKLITGQADTVAMVRLSSVAEAELAISLLHNADLRDPAFGGAPVQGPTLTVRFHGSANAPPSDNLYVKGLPTGVSQAEVSQLFGTYGSVVNMRLMPAATDSSALVRMSSVEEA